MRDRAAISRASQIRLNSLQRCISRFGGPHRAAPISWLPRLHEIRRSVANSVRSHYDRRDLERLFELQPRAAQKLLELLPAVAVGTAKLVERETLAKFLDGVQEAEDVSGYIEQVRLLKAGTSNRKLRALVRRDRDPASFTSLPRSVTLRPGRLEVSFRSLEELADAMYWLAQMLETAEFACQFAPERTAPGEPEDAGEMRELFAELERLETERATR